MPSKRSSPISRPAWSRPCPTKRWPTFWKRWSRTKRLVAGHHFHVAPGDDTGQETPAKAHGKALSGLGQSQAPHQAQRADVDVGNVIVAVDARELQVVDPHHTHTIDVDHLLVEDVSREK